MKEHFEIKDHDNHGHEHEHESSVPVVPEANAIWVLLPMVVLIIGLHWWRQIRISA